MNVLIASGLMVMIVGGFLMLYNEIIESGAPATVEEKKYQGPVPLGYDLEHFRKTGKTIKEAKE